MTDDEISELAELLFRLCAESKLPVSPIDHGGAHIDGITCPMALLFGVQDYGRNATNGWSDDFITGFEARSAHGYGTSRVNPDDEIQKLGRRFREQALSGEGFK